MDLTSWWPRPKAEGITEELARLQESKGVAPRPDALPSGVRAGGSFPRASRNGYEIADVDAFLRRAPELSAAEIRGARFRTARDGGYDRDAVDAQLERLEARARAEGR